MANCRECFHELSKDEADKYNGYCSICYKEIKRKNIGFIIYLICATVILCWLNHINDSGIITLLLMMCPFVFLPLFVKLGQYYVEIVDKQEQERIQNLSDDEKQEYYRKKEQEQLDNTIDYTIIVSENSKKSLGSAVTRGAIGGALLGPVGLVGGAISGKNKSETTFTVVYKSGRREVITVDNKSSDFAIYAKYIK